MHAGALLIWSRVQVMAAGVFVIVCTLFLVPWRKPMKTMVKIALLGIVFLLGVSIYGYFFTTISLDAFWVFLVALLVVVSYCFAQYRDVRTLFGLFSVVSLNVSASMLSIVGCSWVPYLPLRVLIMLGVHLLYTLCCYRFIRRPLFSLLQAGGRGWLLGCLVPVLPLLAQLLLSSVPGRGNLKSFPMLMLAIAVISLMVLMFYIVFCQLLSRVFERYQLEQLYQAMSLQVNSMERQMEEFSLQQKKGAIFRHDLRHFINFIDTSIRNKLYDEAQSGVDGLLSHLSEAEQAGRQFCQNVTVNSLMRYFEEYAAVRGVQLEAQIALGELEHVDKSELAVLLSNTLENAINACTREPEGSPRMVRVKMHLAGQQLFILVSNSCTQPVLFDAATGLPMAQASREGHGLGLVSVRAFARKYGAQINCAQEAGWLHLRLVV